METIAANRDGWICSLAIDEATGNVYFSEVNSNKITICYALGNNCATVISRSPLVELTLAISLDSENGYIYWGQRGSGAHSIVRADLGGRNATFISSGFSNLSSITLDQPLNRVLYRVDIGENTVGSIDVNGMNKQVLVQLQADKGPFGIQVDADKMYIGSCR